ncbi:MAG: hypothetical protein NUW09_09135, partial [Deltaproteobacteria bacterium]|nr:hypothetical protein [Deltaproteobacteria bacterium]
KKDRIIAALVSSDIPALIKRRAKRKIEALVKKVSGYTLFDLGITPLNPPFYKGGKLGKTKL